MRQTLLRLLLILALTASARAQVLPFRTFLPENGLASSQVWSILQDRHGYLWFGCTGGLSRFNGRQFRTYLGSDGLVENSALALTEDPLGRLWVGTHRGPCLYRPNTDRFFLPSDFGAGVRDFARCQNGQYCALNDGVLLRLRADATWERLPDVGGLESVTAFAGDDRHLYAGTPNGLLLILTPEAAPRAERQIRVGASVNRIWPEPSGPVWMATDNGIFRWDPAAGSLEGPLRGTGGERLFTLTRDTGGSVWAGASSGLLRWDDTGVQRYGTRDGLVGAPVWSSLRDREGNLWFGANNGVSQLATRLVEILDARSGLPGKSVVAISWDEARRQLWLGTTGGLFTYRQGRVEPFPFGPDYFQKYYVWSILPAPDGSLWLGTEGGGVVIQDGPRRRTLTQADGLPGNDVVDLFRDSRGAVWVSTRLGLAAVTGDRIRSFTRREGLPVNYVRCVREIPGTSGLFVGTIGGGLLHYDGRQFRTVSPPNDERLLSVYDLHWQDGRLWIASNYGFCTWNQQEGYRFHGVESGLPNVSCTVFLTAGAGLLWVGTDGGAALLDTKTMKAVKILTRSSGLVADEFTTHNCCAVDGDGDFWFGLFGGACRVRREILRPDALDQARPLIHLDRAEILLAGGRKRLFRDMADTILPADLRSIQFFYDVLWFRDPDNIRVAPKLEGFDEDFPEAGRNFQKEYTNLPPGSYRLAVRFFEGRNPAGTSPLATFWVKPPFWQNPLFLLLAAVGIAFTIFMSFRLRYRAMQRDRERLAEQVGAATRELEKKNSLLARLAVTDELTGLHNRRFFLRSLEQELRRLARAREGDNLSLLMMDIDHFKPINDTWGHDTGDRILQLLSRCLRASIRSTDVSARFGGDEFIVYLPQTHQKGAGLVADKIRKTLEANPLERDGEKIPCTVSVGVVSLTSPIPYSTDLLMELIQRVDTALYRAKESGRNCTAFEGPPAR